MADGISGLNRNHYSDAELKALAGNEDLGGSGQVLAKIARDAGYKPMITSGEDKTYDQLVEEFEGRHNPAEAVDVASHAAEATLEGLELAGVHAVEASGLGAAGAVTLPVTALGAGVWMLAEKNHRGVELSRAIAKDEIHVAMLANLNIPDEFRQKELAKYPEAGKGFQSGAQKMTSQIAGRDHVLMAAVQLQCDKGMNAARELDASGANREQFLNSHPSIAKACAEDPAFRAGFDCMVWAKDRPEVYQKLSADLDARDARYDAAHVAVRG